MDNYGIFGELRSIFANQPTPHQIWNALGQVTDKVFLQEVLIPYCHERAPQKGSKRFPLEFYCFSWNASVSADLERWLSDPRGGLVTSLILDSAFLYTDQEVKQSLWEAFVGSPYLYNVKILDLSWNHLEDSHIASLVKAPFFSSVLSLGLDHNNIGDEGIHQLRAQKSPVLEILKVTGNPLSDQALQSLMQSKGSPHYF